MCSNACGPSSKRALLFLGPGQRWCPGAQRTGRLVVLAKRRLSHSLPLFCLGVQFLVCCPTPATGTSRGCLAAEAAEPAAKVQACGFRNHVKGNLRAVFY